MIPFVDIHTHHPKTADDLICVQNLAQNEWHTDGASRYNREGRDSEISARYSLASAGLHPWFLTKENAEKDFEKLTQLIVNQNIIAIGECGLDRLRGENLDFQTQIFTRQIQLAESVQKPVIIHCVRAFNEVIVLKKKLKPTVPLIIHGFNKNATILAELLKNGFYISVGEHILRGPNDFKKSILTIPLNRLFFETDDKDIPIQRVYEAYSFLSKIEISNLKSIIYDNLKSTISYLNPLQ